MLSEPWRAALTELASFQLTRVEEKYHAACMLTFAICAFAVCIVPLRMFGGSFGGLPRTRGLRSFEPDTTVLDVAFMAFFIAQVTHTPLTLTHLRTSPPLAFSSCRCRSPVRSPFTRTLAATSIRLPRCADFQRRRP
jgi:hypothetical protein